jgi:hypothetical protein
MEFLPHVTSKSCKINLKRNRQYYAKVIWKNLPKPKVFHDGRDVKLETLVIDWKRVATEVVAPRARAEFQFLFAISLESPDKAKACN